MNLQIRVPQVRVIDEEGQMLGVMTPSEGMKLAEERGLDLIEVAPTATPPTCKIMDFGKWKYEQKKKAHEARKNQTTIVIKELQLRPRTEQHDLDVKMRHARRFLEEGFKTKLNMRFRGRELVHQEIGQRLLEKVVAGLKDIAMVEVPPKMEGKQLFLLMAPDPVKIREIQKNRAKLPKEPLPADEPSSEIDEDDDEE